MSGKRISASSTSFGHNVVITRGFIRSAAIQDEEWIEGELFAEPEAFIRSLQSAPPADIFTFARPFPNCERCHPFHFEFRF